MNNSIKPGLTWYDINDQKIHAHGGALFYENDTYYWYGENKEKTSKKGKIWTWGVRCYSSKDLYNWQDEGLIIEPELEDKSSILHPYKRLDRPHIIYNEKTGKYVCWLKFSGKMNSFAILISDTFKGPYRIVTANYKPYGETVGDFDIAVDSETKKAYIYFEYNHRGVAGMELSMNYCSVVNNPKIVYENIYPPFAREGITLFMRNEKKYLLTSGMSGYIPNPSEVATFDEWLGPITVQGNPHVNDDSFSSFNSQISQVFKHPKKKDLYIALADRWVPSFKMDKERYDWISRAIGSHFDKKYKASIKEKLRLVKTPMLKGVDTSKSEYVWLPLRFEDDKVCLDWQNEWKIEDFE
jgi:hypothetical protein